MAAAKSNSSAKSNPSDQGPPKTAPPRGTSRVGKQDAAAQPPGEPGEPGEPGRPEHATPEHVQPADGLTETLHGQAKDVSPELPPTPEEKPKHPFEGTLDF